MTGPAPNEPPPPYTEDAPGAPPRHTNDIPLPDSPSLTHNPPPLTPGQQSWYNRPRPQAQPQSQPPRQPSPPLQASPAAQYFASRSTRPVQTIALPIRPNSVRADFYYPRDWAPKHDVSLQDWTTFVGFLIPDDVELRDEKRLSPERRGAIDTVMREWNDGFFLQRGLRVVVDDGTGNPGASPVSAPGSSHSQTRPPQSFGSQPHGGHFPSNAPYRQSSIASSHQSAGLSTRERLTRKLKDKATEKDITYSKEGIRMADKFSLSMGGLKVGKFNLDERGMNYAGKPIGPTMPVAQHHQGPPPQGAHAGYPGQGYGPRPTGSSSSGQPYGGPPGGPPQGAYGGPQYGGPPPAGHGPMPPQGQFGAPPSGPPPPGQYPQQQTGTM